MDDFKTNMPEAEGVSPKTGGHAGKPKEQWTKKRIIKEVLSYVFYIALAVCIALLWRRSLSLTLRKS